jgi:membrane protein
MSATHAAAPPVIPPAAPAAHASAALAQPVAVAPKWLSGRLKILQPFHRAFELWSDADGLRMSAAMSFYGILSLAPLLVLIVAVLGWWLDREMLETSLIKQIGALVGQQGADVIKAAIASAREPGQGLVASLFAFVLLLMGATGVFAELQSALERLWTQGTGVAAVDAWWHTATLRLRGVAYVLAFGFLMLVSTVIASLLGLLEAWAGSRLDMKLALAALNQIVSFLITTALFVALMRMSAGPQPRMRHLVRGAAVGALLFGVGKYGLALYLSTAAVVSAYGAAGSLVVLLMWIYFAAAVLLLGAAVARVTAERQGEFASAPTPPPAAAVTAAQAEVRHAGAGEVPPSTATVAAVLSDAASGPDVDGRTSPGERLAASAQPAGASRAGLLGWLKRRTARTDGPDAREALAVVISLTAAYLLTRSHPGAAVAANEPRPEVDTATARALSPRTAIPSRHGDERKAPAWLAVATTVLRGLQGGTRLAKEAAHALEVVRPASGLRTPRAVQQWGGRAAATQAGRALVAWRQWRERQALARAQDMVARDVKALRQQLRAQRWP